MLPTRVVDIGAQGGGILRPRLHISAEGEKARIYRLKLLLGKSETLRRSRTLPTNFERHRETIRLTDLPKTFVHAIFITWKLGYRYLWIDSLRIIQDSPSNWQAETPRKGDIYRRVDFDHHRAWGL